MDNLMQIQYNIQNTHTMLRIRSIETGWQAQSRKLSIIWMIK